MTPTICAQTLKTAPPPTLPLVTLNAEYST
jgi:hypothetical protein